jgi:hypothetical protein
MGIDKLALLIADSLQIEAIRLCLRILHWTVPKRDLRAINTIAKDVIELLCPLLAAEFSSWPAHILARSASKEIYRTPKVSLDSSLANIQLHSGPL